MIAALKAYRWLSGAAALLTLAALPDSVTAQQELNCSATHAACTATCKVGDLLGSVFGAAGGGRNDAAGTCQVKCDQERGQCQQALAAGSAPATPSDASPAPTVPALPTTPTPVQTPPTAAECSGDQSRCMAECNREGRDRSRGTVEQRGAYVTQCRGVCNEQARSCTARAEARAAAAVRDAPPTEVRVPNAPTGQAPGVLPLPGERAPARPPATAVAPQPRGADRVVLISRTSKDPIATGKGAIAYVQQALTEAEARQFMRSGWRGPVRQHQAEIFVAFGSDASVMTRESMVATTLASLERNLGVQRFELRIDVLGELAAQAPAAPPAVAAPSANQGSRPLIATSDKCLELRLDEDSRTPYLSIINVCPDDKSLVLVMRDRSGACNARNFSHKGSELVDLSKREVAAFCRRTGGATPATVSSAQCSCFEGTTPITTAPLPGMR